MLVADDRGDVKDFHERRKRVKYLRYQIDVMNRLWPPIFEMLEDELHSITDFTGMLHDLHNLQCTISELEEPFTDDEEKILFHALLKNHQRYMENHALLAGRKFYSDSPSNFCDRLKGYWKAHQKEAEMEELPQPVLFRILKAFCIPTQP